MKKQKVFGIGFHRTGTTTLQTALETLGYAVVGMRSKEWEAYTAYDFGSIHETVEEFDGFRDMPWPLFYETLAEIYPNAKFILTLRDEDAWAKSCSGNYKSTPHPMFSHIYGFEVFSGNEAKATEVYRRHIDSVREYFRDCPNRYHEQDLTTQPDWVPLCNFLNEPVPDRPFPHANNRPKSSVQKIIHHAFKRIDPAAYRRWVRDKG